MPFIELLVPFFAGSALAARTAELAHGRLDCLLLGLAALALVGQLSLEGTRWQLTPAYLVVGMLVAAGVWRWLTGAPEPRVIAWIGWGLLAATVAGAIFFPAVELPDTTGPFAVATAVRHLIDAGRAETQATDYHGPRELMTQLWYPVDLPRNPAESRDHGFLDRIRRRRVGRKRWRAIPEGPLSAVQARYPVVIFSPSWRGQRDQNLFQVEELASHGYVVVGIDHPYMSRTTVFPDGRVVHAESSDFRDLSSDENLRRSLAKLERELAVRVKDIEFVASELGRINGPESRDRWSARLDLERLGVVGYSFGGASGAQACREDRRFKAGIAMDGSMFGEVAEAGVPWPFLFMDDDTPRPKAEELTQLKTRKRLNAQMVERDFRLEARSLESYGGYQIVIAGTKHGNYTDQPAGLSLRDYLAHLGRINPARGFRIINAYTVAFFDQYLKNLPQPLLEGPSAAFPEVRMTYRPPPPGSTARQ